MAELNFEDLQTIAKEAGFTIVPPGEYHVEVERAEHVLTKEHQKVMFKVMYRLIPGMNGEVKGTVWNNFVVSPESAMALSFFFKHMEAMGLPKTFFTKHTTNDEVCTALMGRQCRIKVEHREWNGAMQPDVKNVKPPIGGPSVGAPAAARPGPAPAAGPGPGPAAAPAAAPGPAATPVVVNGGTPGPAPAAAAPQPDVQPATQTVTAAPAPAAPSF